MMSHRGLCECIPDRFSFLKKGYNCAICNAQFGINDIQLMKTLLYGCSRHIGRVHAISIIFCHEGDCTIRFSELMNTENLWDYFIEVFGISNGISQADMEEYRLRYLKEKKFSSEKCANCGIREFIDKDKKFKVCGGCKDVRYCSQQCQTENWAKHKKYCKLKQASNKKPKKQPVIMENDTYIPSCKCLSSYARNTEQSFQYGICCNMDCHNTLTYPINGLSTWIIQCTVRSTMHIFPTAFCSSKCRKRYTLDKRQYD